MYPRLELAKELLAGDGITFINLDDNEQANPRVAGLAAVLEVGLAPPLV